MEPVFICLGTNLGNRLQNLARARDLLIEFVGNIQETSSIYETASWGYNDSNLYLNQVVLIQSNFYPPEILDIINDIEKTMGRIRGKERYEARIIDLDILFYGNKIYQSPVLTIPHPQIQNRRFVLTPMAEIAGNFIHPVLHTPISKILSTCCDNGLVYKWERLD